MPVKKNIGAEQIVSEIYGFDLEYQIEEQVQKGKLPLDIFLRLSIVGPQAVDPVSKALLRPIILRDFLSYAQDGAQLSEFSRSILESDPAPVMLNFRGYDRSELNAVTADYEGPYYAKDDLVEAVMLRRKAENKTIQNPWQDRTRNYNRHWSEDSVARGLAHAVWRALLARAKPEWMTEKGLQEFWVPKLSKTHKGTRAKIQVDAEYAQMRRELVHTAIFSDSIILELLDEASTSGIRGLGKVSIHDIRLMLSEEHPELYPDK